jgi:hypothetical protein
MRANFGAPSVSLGHFDPYRIAGPTASIGAADSSPLPHHLAGILLRDSGFLRFAITYTVFAFGQASLLSLFPAAVFAGLL